ncbi:MAG: alpha/beta hydrolase [Cyanobium sp.]
MAASLLVAWTPGVAMPLAAAEVLDIHLESLRLPISLEQLETWSLSKGRRGELPQGEANSDLAVWFSLLDGESQEDLRQLLRATLVRDQGFSRQLLDSWAGSQMLAEVGRVLTTPTGQSTTPLLRVTLSRLLEERREVSVLALLRALPEQRLQLQLDGLLELAQQWRLELNRQVKALRQLEALGQLQARPVGADGQAPRGQKAGRGDQPLRMTVAVPGRPEPLPLEIWKPPPTATVGLGRRPWLLIMPGLGGTAEQMGWLAAALAEQGWPAVVLQHPGSDAVAMRATLEGLRPPPGAETLPQRLADLQAVLSAQKQGLLPLGPKPDGVVLIGHSLGGVAALLGAGLPPEVGLERRCKKFVDRLPLTNPSLLLQCQLPRTALPVVFRPTDEIRGVVVYNSFGSLLWPQRGLETLPIPVLMVGGSLDLVTPPIAEQLSLFLPVGHDRSRLVLVDGASHFSPVRVSAREQALLQLGTDLVGASPEAVQTLLLHLTGAFLKSVEPPPAQGLPPQRLQVGGVKAYVMDGPSAAAWRHRLRP